MGTRRDAARRLRGDHRFSGIARGTAGAEKILRPANRLDQTENQTNVGVAHEVVDVIRSRQSGFIGLSYLAYGRSTRRTTID